MKQKGRSLIIFSRLKKRTHKELCEKNGLFVLRGLKQGNVEDKRKFKAAGLNFLYTLILYWISLNPAGFNLHLNGKVNKLWVQKMLKKKIVARKFCSITNKNWKGRKTKSTKNWADFFCSLVNSLSLRWPNLNSDNFL